MTGNGLKFSVVIPVWNRTEELERAINSVLGQTYDDWEVLVVDDRSDNFAEIKAIVDRFNNSKIRLLRLPEHINAAAARNLGVKESTGDWIAFLDSDDYFERRKLEVVKAEIEKSKGCEKEIYYSKFTTNQTVFPKRGICPEESVSDYLFVHGGFIGTPGIVIKRIDAINNLFNESCKKHQDYEFLLRLESSGFVLRYIEQPLWIRSFRESDHNVGAVYSPEYSIQWLEEHRLYMSDRSVDGFVYSHILNRMLIQKRSVRFKTICKIFMSTSTSARLTFQLISTLLPFAVFNKIKHFFITVNK